MIWYSSTFCSVQALILLQLTSLLLLLLSGPIRGENVTSDDDMDRRHRGKAILKI